MRTVMPRTTCLQITWWKKDTLEILQLHLKNSIYNLETFTKKLEEWFDDTMNRVSGWYKRQTQAILFLLASFSPSLLMVDVVSITKNSRKATTCGNRWYSLQLLTAASIQNKNDTNNLPAAADSTDYAYRKMWMQNLQKWIQCLIPTSKT